jgi:hypothetical protein
MLKLPRKKYILLLSPIADGGKIAKNCGKTLQRIVGKQE